MDRKQAEALLNSPSEKISCELKSWLNLDDLAHKVKLIKAIFALRNADGGYIIIGLDDKNAQPSANPPENPRKKYHVDIIQALITTYASITFNIEIEYPEREGISYPIIIVPSGVQVPVSVKKEIIVPGGKCLLPKGTVLFRTLRANSSISSSAAEPDDWRQIMEICFNNREADLGGFIRRHLLSADFPRILQEIGLKPNEENPSSLENECRSFLSTCSEYMTDMEKKRQLNHFPKEFGWIQIGAVLSPPLNDILPDSNFLTRILSSVPSYSHALWMDGRIDNQRPEFFDYGWNTLIDLPRHWDFREFSRLDPSGKFYIKRPISDDASARSRSLQAGMHFDIRANISIIAQYIASILVFSKVLTRNTHGYQIGLVVEYDGLKNRSLSSPGIFDVHSIYPRISNTESFSKFVEFPANTIHSNIVSIVYNIVRDLFMNFDGVHVEISQVEKEVRESLKIK
ncbi:AlbA family DNA-binding domain-containing protein [Gluconobacter kondonii]|uniref:AlbA family DNA-binding domain-containing protein n=1 Tax=Gluconobacter kondonii TaxID=941463 RepID=UPI00197DBEBC|nr:RNA-binding domain-containing protein [Gluconobacter kondonii]